MQDWKRTDRRGFLKRSAAASAGLAAAPALIWLEGPAAYADTTTPDALLPFVDHYTTNVITNLTAQSNAAVDILSGMSVLWKTGSGWNDGIPLEPDVLRANMRYCAETTARRTEAQAKDAFIHDRQDQSYGSIAGLGPLADLYKAGALAVTSITSAPDATPSGLVNEAVPPGAPAGAMTGAGSPASELGLVVQLVHTLRGNYASGNPSKYAFEYPRPWRMNEHSQVIDTGKVDQYGFPIYESDVAVAPQLLLQRSTSPKDDGGFPSGHTNAFYLSVLALGYAVPERFQELIACASALSHSRIVAGMHSTVDVIGGRTLATALAAATLCDPQNAQLKAAARSQALAYFLARTGTTVNTLFDYAHSAGVDSDPYADRAANAALVTPRLTYILPRRGPRDPMVVPKGAEVLLETRQPYLTDAQRRDVLSTTALPSGYAQLDGPEQWGRLNLFAAADGYGSFETDVHVVMQPMSGGFNAKDAWRNDIDGPGGLTVRGGGTLILTGDNSYRGGTSVVDGTLVAASATALGRGDVLVQGTLTLAPAATANSGTQAQSQIQVHGDCTVCAGGELKLEYADGSQPSLAVAHTMSLDASSILTIDLSNADAENARPGDTLRVLNARKLRGRFGAVRVLGSDLEAVASYCENGVVSLTLA
jgi:autotransporter-associated beta strand protein